MHVGLGAGVTLRKVQESPVCDLQSDISSVNMPVNLSTSVYAEFLQVLWSSAGTSSQIRQGSCGCRTSSDGRSGVHSPGKQGEARGHVVTDRHNARQGGGECGVSHM